MIEAVNSVVSNAPLVRGPAAQTDASRSADSVSLQAASVAAKSETSREPVLAPYVSPYIQVDNNYNKAVLQIRDSDTGDVIRQFPSESRLAQRAAEASEIATRSESPAQQASEGQRERSQQVSDVAPSPERNESAPAETSSGNAKAASAAFVAAAQASSQTASAGVSVFA